MVVKQISRGHDDQSQVTKFCRWLSLVLDFPPCTCCEWDTLKTVTRSLEQNQCSYLQKFSCPTRALIQVSARKFVCLARRALLYDCRFPRSNGTTGKRCFGPKSIHWVFFAKFWVIKIDMFLNSPVVVCKIQKNLSSLEFYAEGFQKKAVKIREKGKRTVFFGQTYSGTVNKIRRRY